MSEYIYPCAVHSVSDDFQDHVNRGSVNPGTDFRASYGDDVWAVASGIVTDADSRPTGGGGRVIHIDLDNGWGVDYLHLSEVLVSDGQRVAQGDLIAKSGASGWGSNWYYGAHVHVSLRPNHSHGYWNDGNVDFEDYVGGAVLAGGNVTHIIDNEEEEMRLIWDTVGTGWLSVGPAYVGLPSMQIYTLFKREITSNQSAAQPEVYFKQEIEMMESFKKAAYLGVLGGPVSIPTFDTAKLADAVSDALSAQGIDATIKPDDPDFQKALDDAFTRATKAWANAAANVTAEKIGFDPVKLADAVAQSLQKTGVVTTVDTKAVQDAVIAAMDRATAAIGKSLQSAAG